MDSVNLPACACPADNPTCVDGDAGEIACSGIEMTGEQCPAGTYLNRGGAKAANECKICPLGSYCPELMACEVGQTCASSGMSGTCPEGLTCYYGTQWYESCPVGTYGKFDMLDGTTRACETCPGGYICATTGMTVPVPCGKGYYSADGESTACTQCDVGHYCERDDTSDTMMTANTCGAGY